VKTVHKSVLIWYSASQMFDLVTDVARYPQFLPWCDQSQVIESSDSHALAQVGISFMGVRQSFTTRNTYMNEPGDARQVHMQLVQGPFSQLDGGWHFTPVGAPEQNACKVELRLNYDFDSATLAALVGPVFDKIASSLVDAFVKRAEQVYA
jgi:ribosome-associated toxin RatA of RatAB toxin-antitoxin module